MKKAGKISLITAGTLAVLVGGGAVLYNTVPSFRNMFSNKTSVNSPNLSIGGNVDFNVNEQHTSEEYIALISQYSREVDNLKTQIRNNNSAHEQQVASMQQEIDALQSELETLTNEDAEIIAEKNARIEVLKQYIRTMESEHQEELAGFEGQISELNTLLANYEKKILATIKLPSEFVFTSLGFKIIEGNDFIFYSTSHSCKLYYYHFESKTLEAIPIKGTSFDSFYKLDDLLYFRTSKIAYAYDFNSKEISILGSANGILTYITDYVNCYMFDHDGGYAVHNMRTGAFTNFLTDGKNSNTTTVMRIDNYILHTAYYSVSNKSHSVVKCFDTNRMTDHTILDESSVLHSFVKTSHGYYMCMGNGFFKLNISDFSIELIHDFHSTYNRCYTFGDKIVIMGYGEAFMYDGTELISLATYEKGDFTPHFIKITNDIYYMMSGSSSYFKGMWKLDLNLKTLDQLTTSYNEYYDELAVAHYKFVSAHGGIYVIDITTGTIDTLPVTSNNSSIKFNSTECGKYTLFFGRYNTSGYSSYIYFYDSENDVYGKINSTTFIVKDYKTINNLFYITTDSALYVYNLNESMDHPITTLTIDATLSNLQAGVFYQQAGTLDGAKLYIKYTLQDNGSFVKDLVII